MQGVQGSISVMDSTFRSNAAFTAGGALAVTERKAVSIANSTFSNNTLLWKDIAAGGGFYCFLCNSVNITSSRFDGNRAVYGGGVALLQPWQPSLIYNTSFRQNKALPTFWDNSNKLELSFPGGHGLFSSSMAAILQKVGGQAEAMDILGPIAANVTGDSGYYAGGGGLYVSLSSGVRLEECVFMTNTAHIGGGTPLFTVRPLLPGGTEECTSAIATDRNCGSAASREAPCVSHSSMSMLAGAPSAVFPLHAHCRWLSGPNRHLQVKFQHQAPTGSCLPAAAVAGQRPQQHGQCRWGCSHHQHPAKAGSTGGM